jgi:hypothetical protein
VRPVAACRCQHTRFHGGAGPWRGRKETLSALSGRNRRNGAYRTRLTGNCSGTFQKVIMGGHL